MEEVVVPVIEDYRMRLSQIVQSELAPEQRLRQIIGLLADLYGQDTKILAIYRSLEEAAPEDAQELAKMTLILSDFFYGWRGDERTRSFDAAVLQGAVRGMCEFAERARAESLSAVSATDRKEAAELDWLEPLHRMLVAGRNLFVPGRGDEMMAIATY